MDETQAAAVAEAAAEAAIEAVQEQEQHEQIAEAAVQAEVAAIVADSAAETAGAAIDAAYDARAAVDQLGERLAQAEESWQTRLAETTAILQGEIMGLREALTSLSSSGSASSRETTAPPAIEVETSDPEAETATEPASQPPAEPKPAADSGWRKRLGLRR